MSSFAFTLCWSKRPWLLQLWHNKYLWSLPQHFLGTSAGGPWSARCHGRAAINWIVGQTFCLQTRSSLTCEVTLWKGWIHTKSWCGTASWGSTQCHLLRQAWCTQPLNDPDPAEEMCKGKSSFPVSISYVCSFLIQRIPNNDFYKNWCYILCLSWISQKNQLLLEFNSQVIVQNRVPRQKYDRQYYPGFSFCGSFFFYFNTF